MGARAQSTTTEKLVVSRAVDIYGDADEASVTRYIAAMYGYIHPNRWKEIYQEVLDTYREHGYLSPVDFCEDLRLDTARRLYTEKMLLRNRLLEGEDVECPSEVPEHDWNIGNIERINGIARVSEDVLDNRQLYPTVDPRIIRQHVEAMNKRQEGGQGNSGGTSKTSEAKKKHRGVTDKEKKRFYQRMSDEEREVDDFLDKMEEEDYNTPRNGLAPNMLRGKYPIIKASSQINSRPTGLRGAGESWISLENQYRAIAKKIAEKAADAGGGESWRNELRILVQYHMKKMGMLNELEKANVLIDSSSMTHVLMNILMLLQETISRSRSEEVVSNCMSFKKDLLMFGSHYRK
ncbi:hypothetical protein [Encephalitozoon cuniculi GB-M1]|uniref:Uncharacterized protein n=2 Tax=Encephalitozoon cuniculi TaxID=6035 RepID=Q8SVU5_ENCCU|nr:uncharacterized protein ECU04_0770 [Encephalitozoon cuniculi GB-M1]AGE95243.1 hypothetical protein ECU04_0770 [Encephalitozoon cuniculi]KMV66280.1 hypothetical protein M970_040700 [Encephalitozoon cuniculi EcunIII-L]UYI27456.1 hypothetical protein J0A71_06g13260 [Encephalitozoon cuniculi]CAD25264.1 hypothetical protein [Encephalitozoon cuniculi GB-M1]